MPENTAPVESPLQAIERIDTELQEARKQIAGLTARLDATNTVVDRALVVVGKLPTAVSMESPYERFEFLSNLVKQMSYGDPK